MAKAINKTTGAMSFATIKHSMEKLGTLYFALAGIWGFPYGEEIVGTITAVVTAAVTWVLARAGMA